MIKRRLKRLSNHIVTKNEIISKDLNSKSDTKHFCKESIFAFPLRAFLAGGLSNNAVLTGTNGLELA